ncbi:MAG: CRISPR-associated endonuclease Cas2 [Firmicutes bacterium]|nr:CRISPR-associated endonuclease Cas2 [Bacillota bacterium]
MSSAAVERRVVKLLTNYGMRYQYSVFACHITKEQRNELTKGLQRLYNEAMRDKKMPEDLFRVSVIVLCANCVQERMEIGEGFAWPTGSLIV